MAILKLKDIYRALAIFLLIQLILLALFLLEYDADGPLSLENCEHNQIIVEDKYNVRRGRGSWGLLHVTFDGDTYVFSKSKLTTKELYETISIGESIDVYCVESYDLFSGKYLWVVDARTESNVYADIDIYNRDTQVGNVIAIIVFSVLETLLLAVLGFDIFLYSNEIKSLLKKRKNNLKKKNSKSQSNN